MAHSGSAHGRDMGGNPASQYEAGAPARWPAPATRYMAVSARGAGGTWPHMGTVPQLVLRPKSPQKWAGRRIEPPISEPISHGLRPAATAAAAGATTVLLQGGHNPAVRLADWLAYIEAIIGQLYLTILVARLVGLHIAYTGPESQDRD